MNKIEALEDLLPGFQDFLSDLALINLTTALREKLSTYQRNISDCVEKYSEAPSAPLPPVPAPSTANLKAPQIDLAKEREASWRISKNSDGLNQYQNTTIGGGGPEDFYETPMQDAPPALPPTTSRPPIKRVIDEREDFYEDPDDQESGRGSMPPGSCSDEGSGNTFFFPHKGEKIDHQIEEDYHSDSTDYEDVEDVDLELHHQEKQKKPKVDKLEEFKNEHRNEEDIDLIDRLLMLNNYFSTIKSVGKWEKRYCIAKDGQLFIYKSYKDKQSKAQRLPLMGYTVFLLGQQGKQDNVIKIDHHNLKPPLLLASESVEVSNKWVAVLQRYSTINHTIVPGGQPDDEEVVEESPDKKKGNKLFSREKKDATPQLTMDGDSLTGYVNIYGAKYGEAKIRRKWITLQDMVFSCSATKDDPKNFTFSIRGIDVTAAEKKEVKMKGAFKLSKDGEVYLYIEALNVLDAGNLLKKLVSASMNTAPKTNTGGRPPSSSAEESGMVARLLASFETSATDQTDGNQNFKVKRDKEKEVISSSDSAQVETEKEKKAREKKEKKEEKKKKDKKDKKKKKEKEVVEETKEEDVTPSTPTTPSSTPSTPSAPSAPTSEKKDQTKKQSPVITRKSSVPVNKFKDSSMSHLLVKDKLMQDRKELETQKKELSAKRGDLRAKKMSSSDPVEKEKIQKEIDVIQKELSELSKKLVHIASEIEGATGDNKDANANGTSGTSSLTKRTSVRASSPDREKVSKGTVSDRMKMFQQAN